MAATIKFARSLDEAAAHLDAVGYRDHYIVRDTYGRGVWFVTDELGPNGCAPMFEGSILDCVHAIDEVQDEAEAETAAEAAGLYRCDSCGKPGAGEGGHGKHLLCDECQAIACEDCGSMPGDGETKGCPGCDYSEDGPRAPLYAEALVAPVYVRIACNNAMPCGICKMTAGDIQANGYRCACSTEGR